MSIVIKKISKNTIISLVSISGIVLFLITRFFLGMINAQKIESKTNYAITHVGLIDPASADTVSGQCEGNCCENGIGS